MLVLVIDPVILTASLTFIILFYHLNVAEAWRLKLVAWSLKLAAVAGRDCAGVAQALAGLRSWTTNH